MGFALNENFLFIAAQIESVELLCVAANADPNFVIQSERNTQRGKKGLGTQFKFAPNLSV